MSERDPRMNPMAGDELLLGAVRVLVHPCKVDGKVFYELRGKPCQIDVRGWRDWCAATEAKVLKEDSSHE